MFAIGHFALGYLAGKGTSKIFSTKINMPLLLLASVIPDVDLVLQFIFPNIFQHRVLTHSIFTLTIIMIPFFILYRKKALPYYAALLSHALIGDFFAGGAEIFWPLSHNMYGFQNVDITSTIFVMAEIILFVTSLAVMVYAKDLRSLLKPNKYNLTLIVPFTAVLGPLLVALVSRETGYISETVLPTLLWLPSIFWLLIFAFSMLTELYTILSIESSQSVMKQTDPTEKSLTKKLINKQPHKKYGDST